MTNWEFFATGDSFSAWVVEGRHKGEIKSHDDWAYSPESPPFQANGRIQDDNHKQGDVEHDMTSKIYELILTQASEKQVEQKAANHHQRSDLAKFFQRKWQCSFVGW